MAHAFTIGVEEEFQIVDPETWELRSHVSELLASSASLGDQIKRELHQSIVEVGSKICADVTELEREVCHIRRELSQRRCLRRDIAGPHRANATSPRPEGGPEWVCAAARPWRLETIGGVHPRYLLTTLWAASTSSRLRRTPSGTAQIHL